MNTSPSRRRSSAGSSPVLLCCLPLLLAAAAASAQTGAPSRAAPAAVPTAMPGTGTAAAAMPAADRKFVDEAAQGGMAEVELGKLAQQRAGSDAVRQFGARMVQDHGRSGDELKAIAAAKGIAVPAMDRAHKSEADKLSRLSGTAFDQAYMSHMLDAHKKTIALFEKQAGSGSDEDLRAFASRTLPTLREHLNLAQSAQAGMKGKPAPMPATPSRS
jgi:putative membrane protein